MRFAATEAGIVSAAPFAAACFIAACFAASLATLAIRVTFALAAAATTSARSAGVSGAPPGASQRRYLGAESGAHDNGTLCANQ